MRNWLFGFVIGAVLGALVVMLIPPVYEDEPKPTKIYAPGTGLDG